MKKKLKQIGAWLEDRTGIVKAMKPILGHPVPPGAKWAYVFGSATLFCFVLQVVTGVSLALLYQPSSNGAYQSLQFITNHAVMGWWLRGIHYFGASGMILMAGVHMVRVYLTAAYKYPREMNWITGVMLLLLTVAMGFTGQLLRWDENGVWSAVVAAEQIGRVPFIGKFVARLLIGGDTLGGQSLSRFFAYHVFFFPALIIGLISFHLYLVIRNGISEPPKAGRPVNPKTYRYWYKQMLREKGLPFWPYAAWRDVVFSVATMLVILALAHFIGPPQLGGPPDPSNITANPQPDWYLLWIYALYALMPPAIESFTIFLGPLLIVGLLFALPFISNKGERSPIKRPWAIVGVLATVCIVGSLLIIGKKSPWSPKFDTKLLPPSVLQTPDSLADNGRQLFNDKGCLYCHKIDSYGGDKGPELTLVARRLSAQEMTIRIINGGGNMPAYGQSLTASELNELVQFLQTRK